MNKLLMKYYLHLLALLIGLIILIFSFYCWRNCFSIIGLVISIPFTLSVIIGYEYGIFFAYSFLFLEYLILSYFIYLFFKIKFDKKI
jgi:hypothetical protein